MPVKVTARAARDELLGWRGDRLRVRIAAVPAAGQANAALEGFLAATAGVAKRDVRVAAGQRSSLKLVEFAGLEQAELDRRFGRPPG